MYNVPNVQLPANVQYLKCRMNQIYNVLTAQSFKCTIHQIYNVSNTQSFKCTICIKYTNSQLYQTRPLGREASIFYFSNLLFSETPTGTRRIGMKIKRNLKNKKLKNKFSGKPN